jgi:hypothetical protein
MGDNHDREFRLVDGAGSNVLGLFFALVMAVTLTFGAWYILSASGSLAQERDPVAGEISASLP